MRRVVGMIVAIAPFAWVISIDLAGRSGSPIVDLLGLPRWAALSVAIATSELGTIVVVINVALCVIRPIILKFRHGSYSDVPFVSGIPLFGTWLVALGFSFCPPFLWIVVASVGLMLCDIGGFDWFVICTWRDKDLWSNQTRWV
jgi:hypothetical protein